MTEKAIICLSLYYEDVVTEQGEKNGNMYMTIRTVPRCKLESCIFPNDSSVWCPLKDSLFRIKDDNEGKRTNT